MFTPALEIMLAELESSRLEVGLVPCRRRDNVGGCIRVKMSQNCDWYRRYCAQYPSSRKRNHRKFDTKIKRRDTVRVLNRLIAGKPSRSMYAPHLLAIAKRLATKSA